MLLCDIGNTSYHFLDGKNGYKEDVNIFNPLEIKETVFYICVNPKLHKKLTNLPNWIDLANYIDLSNYYKTMGIDRVVACEAIKDGLVLDAGSAITVDVVKNGKFEGGFIYPGIRTMQQTYKNISTALDYSFNFECDFDIMPKNSKDAISYGYLKLLQNEVISKNIDIFLTGGDATKLAPLFPNATIKNHLLFDGMKKIIKKANLC